MQKCTFDCVREGPLASAAYSTITANATHWFSCYKEVSGGPTIQTGRHKCTMEGQIGTSYSVNDIDNEYSIGNVTQTEQLYSCMADNTTMILAVSSSNAQKHSLYSLDTNSGFSVTSKTLPRDLVVMSMTCKDRVILVATSSGLDYWGWDNGVRIRIT